MRLGRALGYGTRHAAKTLAAVAEAATAPDPRRPGVPAEAPPPRNFPDAPPRQAARIPSATHVRQAGRSFWKPLATFSSALWLRVTGLFFGLIAFAMGNGAWRLHSAAHPGAAPESTRHFWLFLGFGVLFGYFAVSSFVRASLRERRAVRG